MEYNQRTERIGRMGKEGRAKVGKAGYRRDWETERAQHPGDE